METLKCFQGPCGAHFSTAAAAFSAVVLSDSHRFGHRVSPALKGAQLQACVQRGWEPQMWRLKWFQSLLINCSQFYKRKAHLVGWNGTFSSTPFPSQAAACGHAPNPTVETPTGLLTSRVLPFLQGKNISEESPRSPTQAVTSLFPLGLFYQFLLEGYP